MKTKREVRMKRHRLWETSLFLRSLQRMKTKTTLKGLKSLRFHSRTRWLEMGKKRKRVRFL
jgi:hypothetical protein